jgi:WD40 repeat protein
MTAVVNSTLSLHHTAGVVRAIPSTTFQIDRSGDSNVRGHVGSALSPSVTLSRAKTAPDGSQCTQRRGFVHGNFSSGKVCNVDLKDKSFCMAYEPLTAAILVVGTASSLDFYHAADHSYALVHSTPTKHMISAVQWVKAPPSIDVATATAPAEDVSAAPLNSFGSPTLLLATTDLAGLVALYSIDLEILESQGPTLLYEASANDSGTQIRSLDAGYYGPMQGWLVIVAGDKSGAVTLMVFQTGSPTSAHPVFVEKKLLMPNAPESSNSCLRESGNKSAVLGLAFQWDCGLLAVCTADGLVQVLSLPHVMASCEQTSKFHEALGGDSVIWSMQSAGGAVRSVAFSPPQHHLLAFGGYDKTVVLVDTRQWVISRELSVQGTVRFQ